MEGDAGSGQLTPTPPLTADETVEPEPDRSGPQSRLASGRWLAGVCGGLVVTALVLGALGAITMLGQRKTDAAVSRDAAAVAAAKDCIAATQAPDVKAMNESQRKIVACATENYAPQANLYGGLLADAYQSVQALSLIHI